MPTTKSKKPTKKSRPVKSKNVIATSKRPILFVLAFAIMGVAALTYTFAATTFKDDFNAVADGLITSEYSFWNPSSPDAKKSANWEMTSGALFAATLNGEKVAYSGFPTYETSIGPRPTTTSGNNSAVFRLTSVPSSFNNVDVSFRLYNKQMITTSGTPAVAWDGIHVFLRYVSEENLYYASINRRDGALAIKKKVPGGPSNGGTYYTLASTSTGKYNIPFNTWQNVKATIKTNADNTVTIQLFSNQVLLLSYTDNGSVGGPPITVPGKVGIRGDNDEFYFDDFAVDDASIATTTPPPPTPVTDTTSPTVSFAANLNGSTLQGNATIGVTANDNVSVQKVEYYDGQTLIGASTAAPFSIVWDTTKVSNGSHALKAVAYDSSQNSATTTATVTVSNATSTTSDTLAPTITVASPSDGFVVSKSVSIKASAADAVGVAKMYVYVDGNLRYSTSSASVNTTQGLKTRGTHTIVVTALDAAGNISRVSRTVYKN